jgi:hypothetical protein
MSTINSDFRKSKLFLDCGSIFNVDKYYNEISNSIFDTRFYPKRIGFIAKRIAMWEFLTFLKIWHQLLILLWWILYIFRLNSRKTGSYPLLSAAYFSIYCCFIIAVFIYLINWMTTLEALLRFRPGVFSLIRCRIMTEESVKYFFSGLTTFESYSGESAILTVYKH